MNRAVKTVLLTFFVLIAITCSMAMAEEYRLGPGDILSVGVYGYEELQVKALVVRPDGCISFPLAGEIRAEGMTSAELAMALTAKLADYVKDPQVTVNIDKLRTARIYVLGEVNKPGMYEIERRHNVLDAIGAAGGYTQKAAKKNVFVIKQDRPDQPVKINLLKLLQRGDFSQNVALADGDVVYLTSNHKVNFVRDIMPFISAAFYINDIVND